MFGAWNNSMLLMKVDEKKPQLKQYILSKSKHIFYPVSHTIYYNMMPLNNKILKRHFFFTNFSNQTKERES